MLELTQSWLKHPALRFMIRVHVHVDINGPF